MIQYKLADGQKMPINLVILEQMKKSERIQRIKKILKTVRAPMSVTEIHMAIYFSASRKTIERDVFGLCNSGDLITLAGTPSRFELKSPDEYEVKLKASEILKMLTLLQPGTEFYEKLHRVMAL